MSRFPILMFHSISDAPVAARTPSLHLSPRRFDAVLGYIARLGFRGVSMGYASRRLLDHPTSSRGEKLAVLTFDDGYADNVEAALPALRARGFTATCYVTSGFLGGFNEWDADLLGVRTRLMSPAQVRLWHAAGMEVGAHTRSHCDLGAARSPEELLSEIDGSKRDLEDVIAAPVNHFAYPFGRTCAAAARAVRAAGFTTAATVRDCRARHDEDRFSLPRLFVGGTYAMPLVLARAFTPLGDFPSLAP